MTSRMLVELVMSITTRSMPRPKPPAGGMPTRSASTKSWSIDRKASASSSAPANCSVNLRLLDLGVVQLGVEVAELHAADEQFAPIGQRRVILVRTRQWRNGTGEIDHEGRTSRVERRLTLGFEQRLHQQPMILGRRILDAERGGGFADGRFVVHVDAGPRLHEVGVGSPLEGLVPVDRDLAVGPVHRSVLGQFEATRRSIVSVSVSTES